MKISVVAFIFFLLSGAIASHAQGKLFIIGGGSRPPQMIERLISEAGVHEDGYVMILPMASAEQDSAIWYASRQFKDAGVADVRGLVYAAGQDEADISELIGNASLIYLTGGDQGRFMELIRGTNIGAAILQAHQKGAVIAGTSAGAALMSLKMISGNEKKHPEYKETFETIEKDNIELVEGLGLIAGVMIDQHFIKRSRYNRLLSAVFEHPDHLGIGIDESTALLVDGAVAEVVGKSQVVVLTAGEEKVRSQDGLLGAQGFSLQVYLPGDKFSIRRR